MTCVCQERSKARRLVSVWGEEMVGEVGKSSEGAGCSLLRRFLQQTELLFMRVKPRGQLWHLLLSSTVWKVADRWHLKGDLLTSLQPHQAQWMVVLLTLSVGCVFLHVGGPLCLPCALPAPPATTMPLTWTNTGSCSTQAPWDLSTWSSPTSSIARGCRHSCLWMTQCRR